MKKISAAFLAAVLGISTLAGCGAQKVDGTKIVMTVGEEKIALGPLAYLARYQQAQIYQLYSMYFGQTTNIFSQEIDDEGTTYADDIKKDVVDEVTEMVILRQHMGDYSVSLTDEEKTAISKVGEAYEAENSAEVREKIGASRQDVELVTELETIKAKMMEAMAGDIDTNVTEEESQQSKVTYVQIAKTEETSSEDSSADSTASTESTADSSAAEENAAKKANAEAVLEKLLASEDVAAADMDAIAKEVDSTYAASTGTFTTHDPEDTELDEAVVAAAKDLKDGEAAKEVVEGETAYFVVRMDAVNDEEETEKKKEDILSQRKQTNYDEKMAAWKEETSVTVDEGVWKTLVISDLVPYNLGTDSTESTDSSTASSAAESTSSAVESTSSADESTASAAESTASAAESTASAAESTASAAESTASAAESTASVAESTADSSAS